MSKNRALLILASLRLAKYGGSSSSRFLHSQASQFPHFSPSFSSSLSKSNYLNTHQNLYFSSESSSIVELFATNDWSDDIKKELEKSHPTLTHENVTYVLKKLEEAPLKAVDFLNWVSNKHGFKPSTMVYSLMLRILGNKESFKEFWDLTEKMSEEGLGVDERTYEVVLGCLKKSKMKSEATAWTKFYKKMTEVSAANVSVKGAIDLVLRSDLNSDMKKNLEELNLILSENNLLNIFSELYKYPLKAFSFFRWLKEHMGYSHNAVTYNGILRVLAQEESTKEFWSIVKEMKSAGYDLDTDTYLKVSRHFQKRGMVNDFAAIYEAMMDGPYKAPLQDFSLILRDISKTEEPDIDLINRVVKKHEAAGYALSKALYDGMYRCMTSLGKFDEAEKILNTMRNAGFEPDKLTYSHLLFGLGKAGRLEEAIKLLDEMEVKGCDPDLKTWTVLIRGQCIGGEFDQALKCCNMMVEKKFEVDAHLLEVLVIGLCSKRRVDSAYSLVIKLVDEVNVRPSLATYIDLIQNLVGERKLEEGMTLLCFMKKHKFIPFRDPFVNYISNLNSVDEIDQAIKCFTTLEKNSEVDAVLLGVFESVMCRNGMVDNASNLVIDLVDKGNCKPLTSTYKSLIQNLLGEKKLGKAMELVCLMKKHNYTPFQGPFFDYISKFGSVEDATKLLKALSLTENPSSSAYLSVLQSFLEKGRQSDVRELLDKCPHHIRKRADIKKICASLQVVNAVA